MIRAASAPEPPTLEQKAEWLTQVYIHRRHIQRYNPEGFIPADSVDRILNHGSCDDEVTAWLADSAPNGEGEKERGGDDG